MGVEGLVFVRAYEARHGWRENGTRVTVLETADGKKEFRIGGSPAWRNNNPGNLRPSRWNKGQIGSAWGFAVFGSEVAGLTAMKDLLGRSQYARLTLERAIFRYAPPADNNPSHNYVAYVSKLSGVGKDEVLGELSDERMQRVVVAMVAFERGVAGKVRLEC